MPCPTSRLLVNLQYLDLSDNLLTDLTLAESLCNGDGTLKDLRVLNVSGNALKVPLVACFLISIRYDQVWHNSRREVKRSGAQTTSGR